MSIAPLLRKWTPLVLQTLVSAGLLGWIFRDPAFRAHAWQVLTSAHPGWLAAGIFAAGIGNVTGAFRWGIFLRMLKIPLGRWEVLRLSFIGLFFNNFFVGAVGGDAVKVVWLGARGHRKSDALLSVLMDRMSGLGALIVCSTVFILWRLDWLSRSPIVADTIAFVFIYLLVVTVLLGITFLLALTGLSQRFPQRAPAREKIQEMSLAYLKFVREWRPTLAASLLSAVILIAHFFTFYFCALAFDVVIPLPDFFAFMPAVDIISALPVSLGGFGVREQLFVTLLGDLCGVPGPRAVLVSLGGAFLTLLWGMLGLAFLPSYHRIVRPAAAP